MGFLTSIASLLGLELDTLAKRIKQDATAWGIIGALLAIGAIFVLVAINTALTEAWGPVIAPLMIAGTALVLALIVYAAINMLAAEERRRELERRKAAERTALVTTAAMSALPMVLKSGTLRKVGLPLGGVLAAAILMARSNHHRDTPPGADAT